MILRRKKKSKTESAVEEMVIEELIVDPEPEKNIAAPELKDADD